MKEGQYRILYTKEDGSEFIGHAVFDDEEVACSLLNDEHHDLGMAVMKCIALRDMPVSEPKAKP